MAVTLSYDADAPGRGGVGGPMRGMGANKIATGTFAFDDSYPTGGESISGIWDLFKTVHSVRFEPTNGYVFEVDLTNKKVKALKDSQRLTAAVNPPSLATDLAGDVAVTVTGAATTDDVVVIPPADLEAGLVYQGATVTSANTVTVRVLNTSAGTIDGASKTATFIVRPKAGTLVEAASTTDLSALTAVPWRAIGRI